MAIFKKDEAHPAPKPRERSPLPQRSASGDAAISIIGQGMTVVGDVTTEGVVRVEGHVQGTVQAGKAVILGQAGLVDGNVFTEDAVIGGTVSGSITANNRVELQSTCTVRGEIRTRAEHLKLEEGARFTGQIEIIDEESPRDMPRPEEREKSAAERSAAKAAGKTSGSAGEKALASAASSTAPNGSKPSTDGDQTQPKNGVRSEDKQPVEAGR
jgi:cytoskeletal protein CcmA (bactofilin family)